MSVLEKRLQGLEAKNGERKGGENPFSQNNPMQGAENRTVLQWPIPHAMTLVDT